MIRKTVRVVFVIAAVMAAMSFISPGHHKVIIRFKNMVGDKALLIDSLTYSNSLGQPFTVSKFKYYIGDITLQTKSGVSFKSNDYFLVNEEDSASKQISLHDVPEGNYTSISFILGVDSIYNCSGAQTGALDPINGMFWTWNNGYIFLKMEGKSPVSTSPGKLLEFHIGGYKQPANCIRQIKLELKKNTDNIAIKADLAELFKTPTTIDFSKTSSVTDFHGAATIADNYMDMFSIQ